MVNALNDRLPEIRIASADKAALERHARHRRLSLSTLIRMALIEWMRAQGQNTRKSPGGE